MRKALSVLLAVCLLMSTATPAYAAEATQNVVVSTYEELVVAIDVADDGDTIKIAETIYLNGRSIETEKHIKLVPTDDLESQMIYVRESGGTISGFQFVDSRKRISTISHFSSSDDAPALVISNCSFDGLNQHTGSFITTFGFLSAHLYDCTFSNNAEIAVTMHGKNDIVDNCKFENNMSMLSGAAIVTGYNLRIADSEIIGNASGVYNTGILVMENCKVYRNTLDTESGIDIRNEGTISIDTVSADKAFYNKDTGISIPTPMESMSEKIWLYCLTEQDAKALFEKFTDDSGEAGGNTDISFDDAETLPDRSDPPQEQEEQVQPKDTDEQDKTTPVQPPQENDNDSNHDNQPAETYRPSHSRTSRSVSVPAASPAPVAMLQCGNAIIDCSRSAQLAGYGDGQLHDADALTRAQMAQIIYRLLATDSLTAIGEDIKRFADVSPDAWYYNAVSVLYSAGAVNGVGGGQYKPHNAVTWAQALAVLSRFTQTRNIALQRIAYTGWAESAIKTAVALNWIEDSEDFDANAVVGRGEFVELINRVMEKS